MRSQTNGILDEWRGRVLFSIPELGQLQVREFQDDIAGILAAMADALESNDPPDLRRLMQIAPAHGFQRFLQRYDLLELFAEERVLRRVIVSRVELALKRQCNPEEGASLHAMIDIMLQQGVLALVQQQKQELRHTTEAQLKYLSFLSHDLSNNFLLITLNLEHLERQLGKSPETSESVEVITASLATIRRTREGMRKLLQHERLRSSESKAGTSSVRLLEIVEPIVTLAAADSRGKGPRVQIDIDPSAASETNADLLTIVLQNLIGNALKHAGADANAGGEGTVQVRAGRQREGTQEFWNLAVIDDGPGIPQDQLERIFNAFEQMPGEKTGDDEHGFGLGLPIASQAARLLGTTIEVKTQVGGGSEFTIRLPVAQSSSKRS